MLGISRPASHTSSWLRERTILGPRFAGNVGKGGGELLSLQRIESKFHVRAISADFAAWTPPPPRIAADARDGAASRTSSSSQQPPSQPLRALPPFDLVLCSEVVEHVGEPEAFVRKLLLLARVVVLAVPYKWERCDSNTKCHHVNNMITREQISRWAGGAPLAYDIAVEPSGEQRIICVFVRGSGGAPRL